jgi:hypothetical protein
LFSRRRDKFFFSCTPDTFNTPDIFHTPNIFAIMSMSMPATRAAAAPSTEALIKQVIDGFGGPGACTLPEDKEVFSHHEAAFERVQRYAFANGFAIVESQVCTHVPGGRPGY